MKRPPAFEKIRMLEAALDSFDIEKSGPANTCWSTSLLMRPPRVELGSREPESHVRSITLRARQQIVYYPILFRIASII